MIQVPTLTVFVSMRWTMWMRTSCRLLLTTSRKNTVWQTMKPTPLLTCQSLKLGPTTIINITRIPRVPSCPLTIHYVKRFWQLSCVRAITVAAWSEWLLTLLTTVQVSRNTRHVMPIIFSCEPMIVKCKLFWLISSASRLIQKQMVSPSLWMSSNRPSKSIMRTCARLIKSTPSTISQLPMPQCWPTRIVSLVFTTGTSLPTMANIWLKNHRTIMPSMPCFVLALNM